MSGLPGSKTSTGEQCQTRWTWTSFQPIWQLKGFTGAQFTSTSEPGAVATGPMHNFWSAIITLKAFASFNNAESVIIALQKLSVGLVATTRGSEREKLNLWPVATARGSDGLSARSEVRVFAP
jgi:hypothetical protein